MRKSNLKPISSTRKSESEKKFRPNSQLKKPTAPINPFLRREEARGRKQFIPRVGQEIRRLQNTTEFILPKRPFQMLVREICEDQFENHFRWTSLSLDALQSSAQEYMVQLFEDSYLCALHTKRVTMLAKDLRLARRIRGIADPGNR